MSRSRPLAARRSHRSPWHSSKSRCRNTNAARTTAAGKSKNPRPRERHRQDDENGRVRKARTRPMELPKANLAALGSSFLPRTRSRATKRAPPRENGGHHEKENEPR